MLSSYYVQFLDLYFVFQGPREVKMCSLNQTFK